MKKKGFLKRTFQKATPPMIIGVHGLGNKPSMGLITKWWKLSLIEGLKKVEGAPRRFSFRMAYWADLLYEKPLNPRIKDFNHPLHIEEPYIPEPIPSPTIRQTPWHYLKMAWETFKQVAFLSRHGLANYRVLFDMVVKANFKDLDAYYEEGATDEEKYDLDPVRKSIRQRLRMLLQKYQHRRILIVGHSMGSLIAYDVLSTLPDQYEIEAFISIGSPLGLPILREKIADDHGWEFDEDSLLPTPDCINRWYNYSDKEDHFAVFDDLNSFYQPNKLGVCPEDVVVNNDYKDWVTNNAHKSFGYLRTPQLARAVGEFLGLKRKTLWQKGKELVQRKKKKD